MAVIERPGFAIPRPLALPLSGRGIVVSALLALALLGLLPVLQSSSATTTGFTVNDLEARRDSLQDEVSTLESEVAGATPDLIDVEVQDVTGQQTLSLKGVKRETPIVDLIGMSQAHMSLPPVAYLMRDEFTSRVLRHTQTVGEVSRERRANLTIQPDAKMG